MSLIAASRMAVRPMARRTTVGAPRQQKRTFLDWMTNYPDRVNELKKQYQAGGRSVYTWQKQPNDKYVTGVGVFLITIGVLQLIPGYYRLASGKGKMD